MSVGVAGAVEAYALAAVLAGLGLPFRLGFDGARQAGAAQHGELGRVPLDRAVCDVMQEGVPRRRGGMRVT